MIPVTGNNTQESRNEIKQYIQKNLIDDHKRKKFLSVYNRRQED